MEACRKNDICAFKVSNLCDQTGIPHCRMAAAVSNHILWDNIDRRKECVCVCEKIEGGRARCFLLCVCGYVGVFVSLRFSQNGCGSSLTLAWHDSVSATIFNFPLDPLRRSICAHYVSH